MSLLNDYEQNIHELFLWYISNNPNAAEVVIQNTFNCPNCGASNSRNNRFCCICGYYIVYISKTSESYVSVTDYLNKNFHLIAIMGVFGALGIYLTQFLSDFENSSQLFNIATNFSLSNNSENCSYLINGTLSNITSQIDNHFLISGSLEINKTSNYSYFGTQIPLVNLPTTNFLELGILSCFFLFLIISLHICKDIILQVEPSLTFGHIKSIFIDVEKIIVVGLLFVISSIVALFLYYKYVFSTTVFISFMVLMIIFIFFSSIHKILIEKNKSIVYSILVTWLSVDVCIFVGLLIFVQQSQNWLISIFNQTPVAALSFLFMYIAIFFGFFYSTIIGISSVTSRIILRNRRVRIN